MALASGKSRSRVVFPNAIRDAVPAFTQRIHFDSGRPGSFGPVTALRGHGRVTAKCGSARLSTEKWTWRLRDAGRERLGSVGLPPEPWFGMGLSSCGTDPVRYIGEFQLSEQVEQGKLV